MIPLRDVNPTVLTPVVTVVVIALNVLVFFGLQPRDVEGDLEFTYQHAAVPCEITTGEPLDVTEIRGGACVDSDGRSTEVFPNKQIEFSVLASMFLHGGLLHLGFNMWSLWIFGNNVEEAFGKVGYVALYLAGGIVATLAFVFLNRDGVVPLVGASGAIAAVMGAYLVIFPTHRILTFVFVFLVPLPAIIFIGIWFIGQFQIDPASNVAWEAHVGGFVFGVAIAAVFRNRLRQRIYALHSSY